MTTMAMDKDAALTTLMAPPEAAAAVTRAELAALQNLDRLGVIKTRNQRIVWSNPAAQAMLDYPARKLQGSLFTDLLPPGVGSMLLRACQPFWMAGLHYCAPVCLLASNGQSRTLDVTACDTSGNGEEILWTLMELEAPCA